MSKKDTIENGIEFEVAVTGDGSDDKPFQPAVFDRFADGYFHLESIDMDALTAVCWIDKDRSPQDVVEDVRNESKPLGTVLSETEKGGD